MKFTYQLLASGQSDIDLAGCNIKQIYGTPTTLNKTEYRIRVVVRVKKRGV